MNRILSLLSLTILLGISSISCDKSELKINTLESLDLTDPTNWKLASTPVHFPESALINDLTYGYNRAKLAWYSIDPLFLRDTKYAPDHIKNDIDQLSSHLVREIYANEIFPDLTQAYGAPQALSVLNMAYYPTERGQYNYDSESITSNGELLNPTMRWGGIMSNIESSKFSKYIDFWLMDPFIENNALSTGGDLYIDLGKISEDILKDSRKSFEHGLHIPRESDNEDKTVWGIVSKNNNSSGSFDLSPSGRLAQDVGLDGLNSIEEMYFYADYIRQIEHKVNSNAFATIANDPSSDDYHFYRGSDYDNLQTSIIERYKNYNNQEANSLSSEFSPEYYSTAAHNYPDNEDINNDNKLNTEDAYHEFNISLRPNDLIIGQNYIVDKVTSTIQLVNGKTDEIIWYHFKIPIENNSSSIGNVDSLEYFEFIRLYLTKFESPIVLRIVELKMKNE